MSNKDIDILKIIFLSFDCILFKISWNFFKQSIQQMVWQEKQPQVEAFSKLKLLNSILKQEDIYLYRINKEMNKSKNEMTDSIKFSFEIT